MRWSPVMIGSQAETNPCAQVRVADVCLQRPAGALVLHCDSRAVCGCKLTCRVPRLEIGTPSPVAVHISRIVWQGMKVLASSPSAQGKQGRQHASDLSGCWMQPPNRVSCLWTGAPGMPASGEENTHQGLQNWVADGEAGGRGRGTPEGPAHQPVAHALIEVVLCTNRTTIHYNSTSTAMRCLLPRCGTLKGI
jgi:hypothetical protein